MDKTENCCSSYSSLAQASGEWKEFESSGGFQFPEGSVVSPDASFVRLDCSEALTAEERRRFAPLCPDLVVELPSPRDEGPRGMSALRRKMADDEAVDQQVAELFNS